MDVGQEQTGTGLSQLRRLFWGQRWAQGLGRGALLQDAAAEVECSEPTLRGHCRAVPVPRPCPGTEGIPLMSRASPLPTIDFLFRVECPLPAHLGSGSFTHSRRQAFILQTFLEPPACVGLESPEMEQSPFALGV